MPTAQPFGAGFFFALTFLMPVICRRACARAKPLFSVSRGSEIPKFQTDSSLIGTELEFWNRQNSSLGARFQFGFSNWN